MTARKYLVKYLHPILKANGFIYQKPFWMTDSSKPWRVAIETTSGKFQDGRWFLDMDIGFFSYEIDGITDAQARQFKCERRDLPLGVITSHFQSSIFSLDEDADWSLRKDPGPFFHTDSDMELAIKKMSVKFINILPKLIEKYANYEALIDCKNNSIGTEAKGKKAGLFAAAASVLLQRYDEAEVFLAENIRPGSSSYDKKIGVALSQMIPR